MRSPACPLTQRATRLLLDVLGSIHEALLNHAVHEGLDLAAIGPALTNSLQQQPKLRLSAMFSANRVGQMEKKNRPRLRTS